MRVAGIVVGSVGAAAAIAGGVLVGLAASKKSALQSDVEGGKLTYDTFLSRDDAWKSQRTAGIACLAGGGVALVGGVVLYAVGAHARNHESGGATVSFVPAPGFGLLSFSGAF
jgi:hypothetical protein